MNMHGDSGNMRDGRLFELGGCQKSLARSRAGSGSRLKRSEALFCGPADDFLCKLAPRWGY